MIGKLNTRNSLYDGMPAQIAPPLSAPLQPKEASREILLFFSTNPQKLKRRLLKFHDAFRRAGNNLDVAIIGYLDKVEETVIRHNFGGRDIPQYIYGPKSMTRLGYPYKGNTDPFKLIPGNCDLPVLLFWRSHPEYSRFWVMEDDVEYSGDPYTLFKSLQSMDGDLLTTHVNNCFPEWDYVKKFRSGEATVPVEKAWLCFLPFFVVNAEALRVIDACYLAGWDGHHEMSWPTILKQNNKMITDIGGQGPYVKEENKNKHYIGIQESSYLKSGTFGTMTIRLFRGRTRNVLWHPVKPIRPWLRQNIKRYRSKFDWIVNHKLLGRS